MSERSERIMNTVSLSPRSGDGLVGAVRRDAPMSERSERIMNTVSLAPRSGDGLVGAARRDAR